MVTGFGGTMNGWNQTFIGILATKYHVYTYDHRGMVVQAVTIMRQPSIASTQMMLLG